MYICMYTYMYIYIEIYIQLCHMFIYFAMFLVQPIWPKMKKQSCLGGGAMGLKVWYAFQDEWGPGLPIGDRK